MICIIYEDGLHDLILALNSKVDSHSCISCDSISQVLSPKHEILSRPLRTVLFLGVLTRDFCSFKGNKSLKIFHARLYTTLNISIARNRRSLI